MSLRLSTEVPSGSTEFTAVQILAREVDRQDTGHFTMERSQAPLRATPYFSWQTIPLAAAPTPGRQSFTVTYHAAHPGAALEIWGYYDLDTLTGRHLHPEVLNKGQPIALETRPMPWRGTPDAMERDPGREAYFWRMIQDTDARDVVWRLSSQAGIGRTGQIVGMVLLALGLLLTLGAMASACRNFLCCYPWVGLTLLGLTATLIAIRLHTLAHVSDTLAFAYLGNRMHESLWFDSGYYFKMALDFLSDWNTPVFTWVAGMSTLSAIVFEFTGIDPWPALVTQSAAISLATIPLYAAALLWTGRPILSLIVPLLWALAPQPIPYQSMYLTESWAMVGLSILLATAAAIHRRGADPASMALLGVLFAALAYIRDVTIVYLPVLGMAGLLLAGPGLRKRAGLTTVMMAAVVLAWAPSAIYHQNKGTGLTLYELLPMNDDHFYQAKEKAGGETDKGTSAGFVMGSVKSHLEQMKEHPLAYAKERGDDFVRFWTGPWGYHTLTATQGAPWTFRSFDIYALAWIGLGAGLVIGFTHCPPLAFMAAAMVYGGFFHVFLYPTFTGRAHAFYFPLVLLAGGMGWAVAMGRFLPGLQWRWRHALFLLIR